MALEAKGGQFWPVGYISGQFSDPGRGWVGRVVGEQQTRGGSESGDSTAVSSEAPFWGEPLISEICKSKGVRGGALRMKSGGA